MNFQAVSVGQKLPVGGYTDAFGTPSSGLAGALAHTDESLGKMVKELHKQGLFSRTLIIITAKHGQSPIDRSKLRTLSTNPGISTRPSQTLDSDAAQVTEDDIALIWLAKQATTSADVNLLEASATAADIRTIFSGSLLTAIFNDARFDPRVPDIIVQPQEGVIYTSSTKKIAEQGGFDDDDTHVGLLFSMPGLKPGVVDAPIKTRQVASTILQLLDLDPQLLQAVQLEHTKVLPGLKVASDD